MEEPKTLFEKLVAEAAPERDWTTQVQRQGVSSFQNWPLVPTGTNVIYATNATPASYTSAASILNR